MERFNPDLTLTTTETADLLDVHASTVKRWCNDGDLPSNRTSGGHRRLHLEDVLEFARGRGIANVLTPFHPYEPHVWTALQEVRRDRSYRRLHALAMGWVGRGRLRPLGLLFETLGRDPDVDVCEFCDEGVRGFMRRLGDEWAEGRLRVGDEHLVSQVISDVLVKLRPDRGERVSAPGRGNRPWAAVVGTMEGSLHALGSMCVRLALERWGWDVLYMGPDAPFEDFGAVQRGRGADLVCVSLPNPAAAGDLARGVRILEGMYDRSRPYALAFGGTIEGGVDPALMEGPFREVGLHDTCGSLRGWLGESLTTPGARASA